MTRNVCICSTQFGNVCDLEVTLRDIRIMRIHADLEIV